MNEKKVPVLTIPAAAEMAGISEDAIVDLICCDRIKAVCDAVTTWKGEDIGKSGYWEIGANEIRQMRKGIPATFRADSGEVIEYSGGIESIRVDTNSLMAWIGDAAKVGAGGTASDAPENGDATMVRCGSNPALVYRAWIAEQAGKQVQPGDNLNTLGERIRLMAEERNYRNETGNPIPLGTVIKWIPKKTTGGRGKNGRKPSKKIRPAKSN